MKKFIKDGNPLVDFKAGVFVNNEIYDIIYPDGTKHSWHFIGTGNSDICSPYAYFGNVIVADKYNTSDDVNGRASYGYRLQWIRHDDDPCNGINESISINAIYVLKGVIKIYHNGELMKPDDILETKPTKYIDFDRVKIGSIYKLTIDDDPRFQNTMIMVTAIHQNALIFAYQTRIIYSNDTMETTMCTGTINLMNRNREYMTDDIINKVHLELVYEVPSDSTPLDRTDDDLYYPRGYMGQFTVTYPETKFRSGRLEDRKACHARSYDDNDSEYYDEDEIF